MSEGMRVSHFATGLCVAFGFSSDHYAIQAMTDLLPIIDWQGLTNEQRTRELCERVAEIAARWGGRVDTGRSAPVDLVTINPLDKESATT